MKSIAILILVLIAGIESGFAQTCESIFRDDSSPTALLESSLERLRQEQRDVRNRVWIPSQIREISQKSRLEFESQERAVRYYRGLLEWKIRMIEAEVRDLKESAIIERYRQNGTREFMVDGLAVDLFANPNALKRALRTADEIFQISEPSAQQAAALIQVGRHLKKLEGSTLTSRGFRVEDRPKLEAAVARIIAENFSDVTFDRAKFAKRLLERSDDRPTCCARGNCPGCTHPNVVFRDEKIEPGPTFKGESPRSTLPLYLEMDRLKAEFPRNNFGTNFWDFMFDPTATRF